MKNKIIISSILTIAMCVSLIAGSTFALFTSESKVDVSVSSATVSVTATPTSPEMGSTLGDHLGSANANGNSLTLKNFVPGDYATFTINVKNDSTVAVKYRTVISGEGELFSGLVVTIGGEKFTGGTASSAWELFNPGEGNKAVDVKIALPEEAGDEYQNKSCTLTYKVEAVQGNYTVKVDSADDFVSALTSGADALSLTDNITFDSAITLASDVEIYLNGKELSVAGLEVTGEAHISGGSIVSTPTTNMQPHVLVKSGGELTLENVEVEIDDYMNYQRGQDYAEFVGISVDAGGTLVLDNSNIVVENDVLRAHNYCYGITATNANIIMNGGSITVKCVGGTVSAFATAICSIGNTTLTLNEVTVDAPLLGLAMAGKLVVNANNCTLTSTRFEGLKGGTYELNPVND